LVHFIVCPEALGNRFYVGALGQHYNVTLKKKSFKEISVDLQLAGNLESSDRCYSRLLLILIQINKPFTLPL
jgi:hypothetical protein